MNQEEIKQFIIKANQAGYATGDDNKWQKQPDGSTTIVFTDGVWNYNDNFFGGEPYGGRTIVTYNNKPIWLMVYYGWVIEATAASEVYKILREALKLMPVEAPFRGPKEYKQGEFVYKNEWQGNIENYSGIEKIMLNDQVVYQATYLGGLVDKQRAI